MNKLIKKICLQLTALTLITNLTFMGPIGLVVAEDATASADNTQTGQSSDNTSANTTTSTNDVNNTNTSDTDNTTSGAADSGNNQTSSNTGDGTIDTNNATAGSTTSTTTNTNTTTYESMPWTTWTGEGDWQTRSTNTQTGKTSDNTATNSDTTQTSLTNNNTATTTNTTGIGSNTGTNDSSGNTGDASITTGNADTTTSNQNVANTNIYQWTGQGDWTNLWNGEALNNRTGFGSDNTASNEFDKLIEVLNQNGVDVQNLIDTYSKTGTNTASGNTGNATIQTGNASNIANIFNLANTNIFGTGSIDIVYQDIFGTYNGNIDLSNATAYSLVDLMGNPLTNSTAQNKQTGFNSDNVAQNQGTFSLDIFNDNDGILENDLSLQALTGGNIASENTGDASITTGDASIIANLFNMLNTNIFTSDFTLGVINVYGEWNGNLILPQLPVMTANTSTSTTLETGATNTLTGTKSNNNSDTNLENSTNIANTNDGNIANSFDLAMETGSNLAEDNTMSGSVMSGGAYGDVNVVNWMNTNVVSDSPWWIVLVNNMGVWTPMMVSPMLSNGTQIVLDLEDLASLGTASTNPTATESQVSSNNTLTGNLSDNNANTDITTTTDITNQNNGSIINNIDALALTGQNEASRNTGSGSVTTGAANILVNAINFLNTNIIAPSFLLTVINVFGDWSGNIFNFGDAQAHAAINPSPSPSTQAQGCGNCASTSSNPADNNQASTNNDHKDEAASAQNGAVLAANTNNNNGAKVNYSFSNNQEENEEDGDVQVLSFSSNDSDGDSTGGSLVASQINPIKYFVFGFGAAMLILSAYILRKRVFKLIKSTRINLF
jgi:hypothetical protein